MRKTRQWVRAERAECECGTVAALYPLCAQASSTTLLLFAYSVVATEATLSQPALSLDEYDARHSPDPSEVRSRSASPCTPPVTTRLRFRIIGLFFTPLNGCAKRAVEKTYGLAR
ncbi:hypothetical protein E1301_Tti014535 [Triplophysa tibetana]|uniref:Uncharacterized protein n=1 Tax=Triplophysa tibetana TaxID=1572043 RepID=A0A5A9P6W3_9TELE|nr:hypothetical protein E1301_Tti014535 [Triplophysa tibetana]